MRTPACLLLCWLIPTLLLFAQLDDTPVLPHALQNQIEAFLENQEEDTEFDFNTLGELLQQRLADPLDLNTVHREDLEELGLLSDVQIADFYYYRSRLGPFISLHELQAIGSFDLPTIEVLRPFVTLQSRGSLMGQTRAGVRDGENEIYTRWTRVIQEQRGYQPPSEDRPPRYAGDPNQLYVRFRHRRGTKLSYGLTLEKDPGERLFTASTPPGFDFTSLHAYFRDLSPTVKYLALGDYAISLGQGLVMHSGFGRGKSAFVTQIKRGGRTIRPYTSVSESTYLRGVATTLQWQPWQLTLFASQAQRDANVSVDSLGPSETNQHFTSLPLSGLHRTAAEREDKGAVRQRVAGGQIAFRRRGLDVGLNLLYNHFDQPFQRAPLPYNRFHFAGRELLNLSLNYTYLYKNFHFFGETAASDNGAFATVHGLLLSLSRYVDLALHYRNISQAYHAIQANPFLESSQAINERGFYLGLKVKLNPTYWFSIYADRWRHPWLRFSVDAPSLGQEYFIRITHYQKRKLLAYLQYRHERKGINRREEGDKHNRIRHREKNHLRMHINHQISPQLELRHRLEWSWVMEGHGPSDLGFMIYQDVIFKSLSSPLSFTARVAYFDTDSYDARIYAYENDILSSFSIPAYFRQGMRYYLNIRYRLNKRTTLEGRWEETRLRHEDQIGSGNDQIQGNIRSKCKLQLRYAF